MSAGLIDPRPAPPAVQADIRWPGERHCAREGCGKTIVSPKNVSQFCSPGCAGADRWAGDGWRNSPEVIKAARRHWKRGLTTRQIAALLTATYARSYTKNAVVGIARRNDFPPRPSPIRRKAVA